MARGVTGLGADQRGVCLLEVVIALASGAVVLAATLHALQYYRVQLTAQQESAAVHQDLRLGLQVMEAELRLAGSGTKPGEGAVLEAGAGAIAFSANLDGLTTRLTRPVSAAEAVLPVENGEGWSQGKRLVVCSDGRCAEGALAKAGRRRALTLVVPLGQAFPEGSEVFASSLVRYYQGRDGRGAPVVMRQVDGGANPLIGGVSGFRLLYFDRRSSRTVDPGAVARVRVEVMVGTGQVLVREVGLRAAFPSLPAEGGAA